MTELLKKGEVVTIDGGYVVKNGTTTPIYNKEFIAAQNEAHKLVVTAKHFKNADFVGKKADTVENIILAAADELNSNKDIEFVKTNPLEVGEFTKKLREEAKSFFSGLKNNSTAEEVNDVMNAKFKALYDFEKFGLYFTQNEVQKLEKIYTIEEIVEAVTIINTKRP